MNALDIQTLACGAYGWFQQVLIRLCVCAVVALFAVLVLRAQAVRDAAARVAALWRGATHFTRLAVLTLLSVCIIDAGEKMRIGGGALGDRALPSVTAEEIAQGWRLESVVTNDAVSYAMPDGITPSFNWHKRGTFGEWARLELGDFAFPLGTNGGAVTSFSVFNDGRIRPTPRDAAREICAVGVPMLAMQGASRFWVGAAVAGRPPYRVKRLTWENFFLNADTNAPVNAQIELVANGDFVTRSNDVERIYRRVEPFDWDGDGLENTVDPDPFVAGPDAHGTNAEWYNVVCSNVLEAVEGDGSAGTPLPTLSWLDAVNTNAYYFVNVVTTNCLAPIYFTGDRDSRLSNPVVVARGGETNHVPLLIGINYAVTSPVPFTFSIPDDGFASITTNSVSNYAVQWPLEFTVAPDGTGYRANVGPYDPGCEFLWDQPTRSVTCNYTTTGGWIGFNCNGDGFCECDGCSVSGVAVLEEASFDLPDVWCGCWHYDPLNPGIGLAFTNMPYVAVSFDKSVVFYEDAYTNAPNDVVAKHSTNTTLTVFAYGGDAGGMLYVSDQKIEKLVRVGGKAISFPYAAFVPPQSGVSFSIEYEAETHSDFQNDISVSASMLPGDGGMPCTATTSITVAEILIEADANFPTNKHRHVFGPAEWVNYTFNPPMPSATLQGSVPSHGMHDHLQGRLFMPFCASQFTMTVVDNNASFSLPLVVIEPEANLFIDGVGMPSADDWTHVMNVPPLQAGDIGAVFHVDMSLKPSHVSFAALGVMELYATATDIQGFFTNAVFNGHLDHDADAGAFRPLSVNADNTVGTGDNIFFALNNAFLPYLRYGTFKLEIPVVWYVRNESVTNRLVVLEARNTVYANADVTVSKYLISVTRGTNDVFTISR